MYVLHTYTCSTYMYVRMHMCTCVSTCIHCKRKQTRRESEGYQERTLGVRMKPTQLVFALLPGWECSILCCCITSSLCHTFLPLSQFLAVFLSFVCCMCLFWKSRLQVLLCILRLKTKSQVAMSSVPVSMISLQTSMLHAHPQVGALKSQWEKDFCWLCDHYRTYQPQKKKCI